MSGEPSPASRSTDTAATASTGGSNSPDAVFLGVMPDDDPWNAIHAILAGCACLGAVADVAGWERDLRRRASLRPVVCRDGVAFPHARTTAVKRIAWAAAVCPDGLRFAPDGPACRLIVLIGVPERMAREYLDLVASLSRVLHREGAVDQLCAADSEAQFRAIWSRLHADAEAAS